MGYFHSGFFEIAGQDVYVSRTGWTGELGFEVYTQGNATDWCGAPRGMESASLASMAIRRIEAGVLDNGTDFDMSMTPFEAGLGAFVDLEKENFIGRTALLSADRNKRWANSCRSCHSQRLVPIPKRRCGLCQVQRKCKLGGPEVGRQGHGRPGYRLRDRRTAFL